MAIAVNNRLIVPASFKVVTIKETEGKFDEDDLEDELAAALEEFWSF